MSHTMIEVDARGMSCPMPLLKAKQALNKLAPGEQVKVLATDAGSQQDFQVFCQRSGHSLEHSSQQEGVFTYIIRHQ
jgi:TusA-related sulfurtransferase